jgi:DNA-binding transcriptional ArsR family regulator
MPLPHPTSPNLDAAFAALADPTRRAIVERLLSAGALTVGEVARPFRISMPAVSRHLRVLEDAGLIEREVDKQWRIVRVRADGFGPIESWLARQRRHWTAALDRLEAVVAAETPKQRKS